MGLRVRIESGWAEQSAVSLAFDQDRIVIGRRGGCDVQLPHAAVSGHHATIRASGPKYSVIDEGSTNGVRVNAERIAPRRAKSISDGDVLDIGGFTLVVSMEATAGSTSADGTAAAALRLFRGEIRKESLQPPSLFFTNGPRAGEWVPLPTPPSNWTIGRGENVDVYIDDSDASREHVELIHSLDGVEIRDLGSKNGIRMGERVVRTKRLCHGDEFTLGVTTMRFEDIASESLAAIIDDDDVKVGDLPVGPSSPSAEGTEEDAEDAENAEDPDDVEVLRDEDTSTAPVPSQRPQDEPSAGESLIPPTMEPKASVDVAVYALAGTVLALSLAGLYWLFASH